MRKILVVSDSHGSFKKLNSVIEKEYPFDYIIHCGDGVGDLFQVNIPDGVKVVKVAGNVDLMKNYDIERIEIVNIDGIRIMVTHGDLFRVQYDYDLILRDATNRNIDLTFCGHTHRRYFKEHKPQLFNPGTLSKGQYGIVTLGESIKFEHKRF